MENNWTEWSQYVLKELERLNNCYENMNKEMSRIKVDVGQLQVKAGIFGALGGFIAVALMFVAK